MTVQLLLLRGVLLHLQRNLIITNTGYLYKMRYCHLPCVVIFRLINSGRRTPGMLLTERLSGNEQDDPSLQSSVLRTTGHLPDLVPTHSIPTMPIPSRHLRTETALHISICPQKDHSQLRTSGVGKWKYD